jgi:SNF family Na+-dependent transporter
VLGLVCALPFLLFGVLGVLVFLRLDGAGLGLKYMFWFDWWKLLEWKLWIDCFVQVMFQYFVGLAVYKNVRMILDCRGSKQFQDHSTKFRAV